MSDYPRMFPFRVQDPIGIRSGEVVRREYWGDGGFSMGQLSFSDAMLCHSLWLETGDWIWLSNGMHPRYQDVVTHRWTANEDKDTDGFTIITSGD